MKDYDTVTADSALENDVRLLVRLSIAEDLSDSVDWTSVCLIPDQASGACQVVPRENGICAGVATLPWIVDEFEADLAVEVLVQDGQPLVAGNPIATLRGNVRDLLTSERTILNVLCRLCGIATEVGGYVEKLRELRLRHAKNDTRMATARKICGGLWRWSESSTRTL